MPKTIALSNLDQSTSPDYPGLVQFLIASLLESPESLKIDCEQSNQNQRVWIRIAFAGDDKGRIYGRGGRNLQAIRTVLETAAATVGQSLHLDIYESPGERSQERSQSSFEGSTNREQPRSPRPDSPRLSLKPRS